MRSKIVREILSRRDPQGYYVIPLDSSKLQVVVEDTSDIIVEEAGDIVFVRVKSRSRAERIIEKALRVGALKQPT